VRRFPLFASGWIGLVAGVSTCQAATPQTEPGRQMAQGEPQVTQSVEPLLERYDFGRRTARFDLPGRLDEISGLAFTPDGRLFGHDDERGRVHEIDTADGSVGKRFSLGENAVRDDFEGIAIVGERFFLVSSRGRIYEFREAGDRESTEFIVSDTHLGAVCEIEGLDYDPIDDVLLLACKRAKPDDGNIVVHRIPMDPSRGELAPLRIDRSRLRAHDLDEDFDPSAIAVGPTGTMILLAGRQAALIEVDRSGRIVFGVRLSKARHPQAEGLAFGPDGTLFIADEESGRDARLTVYAQLPVSGGRE